MNNDELERERFEGNWLSRGGEATDLERYPAGHVEPGSGDVGGTYVCDILQGHWQTWKASRAAIEIEIYDFDSFSPHDCGDDAVWTSELIRTLAKHGIIVKE